MGKFGLFFKSMFSEWGSGLSGPASVPFAILALFTRGAVQKFACGLLAAILGFFSAYRVWARENDKTEAARAETEVARAENESLKKKYLDEQPKFGLKAEGVVGRKSWQDAIDRKNQPAYFSLQYLSGRIPTSVRIEANRGISSLSPHVSWYFSWQENSIPPSCTTLRKRMQRNSSGRKWPLYSNNVLIIGGALDFAGCLEMYLWWARRESNPQPPA